MTELPDETLQPDQTVQPNKPSEWQQYLDVLSTLNPQALEQANKLISRLYDEESKRADAIEKKGTYILGFLGLTVTFFTGAAITAAKTYPWWVSLVLASALVCLGVAVWSAYQTAKSQKYMLPDETSLLKVKDGADAMWREHILDTLQALKSSRKTTNVRGGHLERAEKFSIYGLVLLFLSLALILVLANWK